MKITFNTNGSNRTTAKIKAMFPVVYCHSAGLGSKRKEFHVSGFNGDIEETKSKLKALKCTSIKFS